MVQKKQKSAAVYAQLAFFFGWLGIHKFYAGRVGQALAMLFIFLGGLTSFAIAGICMSEHEFNLGSFFFGIGYVLCGDILAWSLIDFIAGLWNANNPKKLFGE